MMHTAPEPFALDLAVVTDVGTVRSTNGDHVGQAVQSKTAGLVVVADGLVADESGVLASERAVTEVLRSFRELVPGRQQTERMVRAVRSANYAIRETALTVPQLSTMRATLTAVAVADGFMSAAHVGHGRVYLVRDGEIVQLSKDHTLAAETGCAGEAGDQLTRQLGLELVIPVDLFEIHLFQHDVVVICTDGVHRVLGDDAIKAQCTAGGALAACHRLIAAANRLGTPDNLSVGVVTVVGPAVGYDGG